MEIRIVSLNFPTVRGSGPQSAQTSVVFPREVDRATAGLIGYSAGFRSADHHVGRLILDAIAEVSANVVTVRGRLGVRDWSDNWDDDYTGTISVAVLADLVPVTAPPSRGDLSIIDMEINQATQFFRSSRHLDGVNARPDNSILLVARKTTGVRVYVDYDANAGLPAIGSLSGELEVQTSSPASCINF